VKGASSITVDAVEYRGKDVVAYVGVYELGRVALAFGQARGTKIYYGCVDPYHKCAEAWFKLRGVDFSAPGRAVKLIAAWDVDNVVVCLEGGSLCFWGRRDGEIRGGSLAEILPELQRVAPHIKAALASAGKSTVSDVVVGIAASGVEVLDSGGERRYYATIPEKWNGEVLGWWIIYGRVYGDYGESCVMYDGAGAGRMLFGECRAPDEIELLASYVAAGDFSVLGGRAVKRARARAVVRGGKVLVAVFDNVAVVGNRVCKIKEAFAQLDPRAATALSRIMREERDLIVYE